MMNGTGDEGESGENYHCETINNALFGSSVVGRRCSLAIMQARCDGCGKVCEIVGNALNT